MWKESALMWWLITHEWFPLLQKNSCCFDIYLRISSILRYLSSITLIIFTRLVVWCRIKLGRYCTCYFFTSWCHIKTWHLSWHDRRWTWPNSGHHSRDIWKWTKGACQTFVWLSSCFLIDHWDWLSETPHIIWPNAFSSTSHSISTNDFTDTSRDIFVT